VCYNLGMSTAEEQIESGLSKVAWNAYGGMAGLFLITCVGLVLMAEVFEYTPDIGTAGAWSRLAMCIAIPGAVALLTGLAPLVFITNRAKWISVGAGVASVPAAWLVVASYWYDALGMAV
jgi:hypothetical protein